MKPLDEAELRQTLAQLAELRPSAGATDRAIARVRTALESAHQTARPPGALRAASLWRFRMRAAIAAVIVLAVGATLLLIPHQRATAAEMWKRALRASAAFDGWIHINTLTLPTAPAGTPQLTEGAWHGYRSRGISITVRGIEGQRRIQWVAGGETTDYRYDSATNQLFKQPQPAPSSSADPWHPSPDSPPAERQAQAMLFGEPTLEAVQALADLASSVQSADDGPDTRFDFRFGSGELPSGPERLTALTVWVSRDTNLISKWQIPLQNGETGTVACTYGPPEINDVYDLGIPRDAVMVDSHPQPPADAEALFDRLATHVWPNEQLGKYVAIQTDTSVASETAPAKPRDLLIWAHDQDVILYAFYRIAPERAASLADLAGWPEPPPDATLSQAFAAEPDIFGICRGVEVSLERYNPQTHKYVRMKFRHEAQRDTSAIPFSLSGSLWPGRHALDLKHPDVKIKSELRQDSTRPGLTGLFSEEIWPAWASGTFGGEPNVAGYRIELLSWVDPARDDLPVESSRRFTKPDGTLISAMREADFTFAQLPGGQWYPATWTTYAALKSDQGLSEPKPAITHRLRIFPDQALPAAWFDLQHSHAE